MKSIDLWLQEYSESHRNPVNKRIHWIAVPLIYVTVFALIWDLPTPDAFVSPWLNWATLISVPVLLFYFALSMNIGIGMTVFSVLVGFIIHWFEQQLIMSVTIMSIIVFVVMWILQFIGHAIEGKKPSFFKDLQFLLIGPAWIMADVLRRLNLRV